MSISNKKSTLITNKRRTNAAEEWLAAAELVAEVTHDEITQRLFKDIFSSSTITLPPADPTMDLEFDSNPSIVLVPLFAEDAEVSPLAKAMLSGKGLYAVHARVKPGVIYLKAEPKISPIVKGLVLMHEALHAELARLKRYRSHFSKGASIKEELTAYEYEFMLLQQIGGTVYQHFYEQKRTEYIAYPQISNNKKDKKLPPAAMLDVQPLEVFLGKPASAREKRLRQSIVHMHLVFGVYDAIYSTRVAKRKKLAWLRNVIEKAWRSYS